MIRYPLAVVLALWLLRPRLQRPRSRAAIFAASRTAAVPLAAFWGSLRARWRKLRQREPRPESYAPRHARCDPPRTFTITPADIGLADWRFSGRRQSARIEDTMPGLPVFGDERIRKYLYASYRPRSA